MKTISKIKYVLFLIVIVGFVSCKGEIGPIGPDGTDGTNGIDGVDGEDGNANVISSDWITPTWTGMPSSTGQYDYFTDDISSEIMNTGVILSYCDWMGDASSIYPIPFTYGTSNLTMYNYSLYVGKIRWWFNAQTNITPPSAMRFRYVIIPAPVTKTVNPQQAIYDDLENAGVDINNYYEVMDYYGLDY